MPYSWEFIGYWTILFSGSIAAYWMGRWRGLLDNDRYGTLSINWLDILVNVSIMVIALWNLYSFYPTKIPVTWNYEPNDILTLPKGKCSLSFIRMDKGGEEITKVAYLNPPGLIIMRALMTNYHELMSGGGVRELSELPFVKLLKDDYPNRWEWFEKSVIARRLMDNQLLDKRPDFKLFDVSEEGNDMIIRSMVSTDLSAIMYGTEYPRISNKYLITHLSWITCNFNLYLRYFSTRESMRDDTMIIDNVWEFFMGREGVMESLGRENGNFRLKLNLPAPSITYRGRMVDLSYEGLSLFRKVILVSEDRSGILEFENPNFKRILDLQNPSLICVELSYHGESHSGEDLNSVTQRLRNILNLFEEGRNQGTVSDNEYRETTELLSNAVIAMGSYMDGMGMMDNQFNNDS